MKKLLLGLIAAAGVAVTGYAMVKLRPEKANWMVAQGQNNGEPLIMRALAELPTEQVRRGYQWLAVLHWEYRAAENGFPGREEDASMNEMEDIVDRHIDKQGLGMLVVSRIGAGSKEWSYYIHDREEFMAAFNRSFENRKRMPVRIEFFHDPEWQELRDVLSKVANKPR
jgi:hypothetical protein